MNTSKSKHGRFRCRYCGDYFNLTNEEMKEYEEGYCVDEPDTCDDCCDDVSYGEGYYPEHSDADPGL